MLVVSLGELDEIYETFLAWLRQEPKVSGCCLCVRDIIQISTPEEFLRVHKGLREGPKRGPKERA